MFSKEKDKRKWTCFICGREYDVFIEFKDHILDNHDEGREYLLCPLPRCGAPIRDVRLHLKAKHNGEKIPKNYNGPLKALIWKDKKGVKKKKTRKPVFREGHFVSQKNGKEFFYRSGYECSVLECLELLPEVLYFDVEPIKGGIPYIFNAEQHSYYPDILVKFNDGHIELWEIKPSNQTSLPKNKAKWASAELYCQARNWSFVVITEQGINKLKKKVKLLKG